MKFFWTVLPMFFFIVTLIGHSFFHDATLRSQQPASMFNIDIAASLSGILGLFILIALSHLNRRITALEKRGATNQQN